MVSQKYEEEKQKNYSNTIKDTPSLCDNNTLLQKQKSRRMQTEIVNSSGCLDISKLMVSPFLNSSWRISSNSCKKTSTQDFLPSLFYGVTLARIESIVLAARNP
jgi:hypothetical protein